MIATIFHEGSNNYPDMIAVSGTTIEEMREEALKEIKKRGWKEDDCWSQVYETKEAL